jgi:cytochrome c oxidase subunit 2
MMTILTAGILALGVIAFIFILWKSYNVKKQQEAAAIFSTYQPALAVVFMILFLAGVTTSTIYYSKYFLPSPSAQPAAEMSLLFNATAIIITIAFLVTQVLLFFFAFRYRQKPNHKAEFSTGNLKFELVWTIVPTVCFVFLFLWGQKLWNNITTPPNKDALQVDVVAQQFNWHVRYPGTDKKLGAYSFRYIDNVNETGIDVSDPASADDFIPVQMHIPKNKTVNVILHSKDVIHSFYVPLLGVKMDAVPGMSTSFHFTPTTSTDEMREKLNDPEFNYEVACAELCGRMHFAMKLIIVVDEPEEFNRWYTKQQSWLVKASIKPGEL